MEHHRLATDYWALQGKVYNLQDDELWIGLNVRVDNELHKRAGIVGYYSPSKAARFPLEQNMYEVWKNLDQNKEKYKWVENRFIKDTKNYW